MSVMQHLSNTVNTISESVCDEVADYNTLSKLFEYPHNQDMCDAWLEACDHILMREPSTIAVLQKFIEFVKNSTLTEIQELFLRSFDVQAITTLDIGYILFGEDYKRGELLVNLNREHRDAGNVCETELSDHLPNVLRLLPLMSDADLRSELVQVLLIPAMDKMIAEFDAKKIEKKDEVYKKHLKTVLDYSLEYRVAYQGALLAVRTALHGDFVPQQECDCCSSHEHTEDHTASTIADTDCGSNTQGCTHKRVPSDFGATIENEFDIEN